ncbi:MAG: hypothetical protein HY899_19705 [Deltaproteobacteria bacterium]|nr:hypothetical protein [Deltaproteobacteria bacterium]
MNTSGRYWAVLLSVAAAGWIASAAPSHAQVTPLDASCRSAIYKHASKLGRTAMKAVDACIKDVLKGKLEPTTDCNSISTADAAQQGKVTAASGRLEEGILSRCTDSDNAAALAAFANCPSPGALADAGGATSGVDDFAELVQCQIDLDTLGIEPLRRSILNPDAERILARSDASLIAKCATAVATKATKLWIAVSRERGKCQIAKDDAGGSYDYQCPTDDDHGRILSVSKKLQDGIAKACGNGALSSERLPLLGSCGSDAATIGTCVADAVLKNAGGLTASSFAFSGICPTSVALNIKSNGRDGEPPGATSLDFGWTGWRHGQDFNDSRAGVSLSCAGSDCGSCAVSANCESGNCRCENDSSIQCSTPFATGGPCGDDLCAVYLAPPVARLGAAPVCVLETIRTPLSGTADVGSGQSSVTLSITERLHLGIGWPQSCPTCSGTEIGSTGTCDGGARDGLPCTTDARNESFGNVSYDCPPAPASDLTGTTLQFRMTLTTTDRSLAFDDACDVAAGNCACGACSLDPLTPCENDAVCTAAGLGACTDGGGEPRKPNDCTDGVCSSDPGGAPGQGICHAGPIEKYCDGILHANGDPAVHCDASPDDCEAVLAGSCTLSRKRPCYSDPITASGLAGSARTKLVSVFCAAPSALVAVNSTDGLPGAGRMQLDIGLIAYCPDGVTAYELGGNNCP